MKPERRRQVERIYHSALEREESQRGAFLAQACAGDEAMRVDESLLAHNDQSEILIEKPNLEWRLTG
jgi:hypothetical protein